MNKHTPGPWKIHWPEEFYQEPPEHADFQIEFGPGDWGGFWVVQHSGIDRTRPGIEHTSARADAYLIAAAPDLLYQLKQVESQLSRGEPFPPAAIVAIRAAIAKAEGGAA